MSANSQIKDLINGSRGYPVGGKSRMRRLGDYFVDKAGKWKCSFVPGTVIKATDRRYIVAPTGQFIRLNPNGTTRIRERNRRTKGAK